MGNMAAGYARIAAVESNSQAHAAGLRVGDFITYPGTKGGVAIPVHIFTNTLSTFRPLVFDVLRPGLDFDALDSINRNNTRTSTTTISSSATATTCSAAAAASSSSTTTGTLASSTSSWPTTSSTVSSAKAPANANGGEYASAAAAAKPPPHSMVDRTNSSSASAANITSKKPVKAEPSRQSTSSSAAAAAAAASRQVEVIELLSDSDEEMTTGAPSSTANRSSQVQQRTTGPARTGTATHRQPGTMRFPPTIDIGFNGNERNIPKNAQGYREESYGYRHGQYQMTGSTDVRLKEIRQIQRSTSQVGELKFIWPTETPVPEASGGFFETLTVKTPMAGQRPAKKSRQTGNGKKTFSRIGRLAGIITIPVNVATKEVHGVIGSNKHTFFLAEHLLSAEQVGQWTHQSIAEGPRNVLEAIVALNDQDNPFKERCLYVIGETVKLPALPQSGENPIFVDVKLHVYFRRALFGLSATPAIKIVLDALKPVENLAGQHAWAPCRQVPASTGKFTRSPRPDGTCNAGDRFDHSLPGLLWANESTGYAVSTSNSEEFQGYEGAKVTLRDYQKETVAWMRGQEDVSHQSGGGVPGLNGYLWERRSFADNTSDVYYYFPLAGHVLLTPPPIVSGGLLAEEMGLGKTVEIIELICSDAALRPRSTVSCTLLGGTLVVLPVSLLSQWKEEMATKAPHLSVEVYYGENAKRYEEYRRGGAKTTQDLAVYDVVLTTMTKLQELTRARTTGTMNILDKIRWHRMVVDECQFLKNDTTVIARAASAINSKHIWMLSGTPLTNKLDDLRGELSLLRVWPFTLGTSSDAEWKDHFWTEHVKEPWDSRDDDCLPVVHSLMSAVSIRHSRLQTRVADGSPLVDLPPRTETFVAVKELQYSSETFINRWLEATAAKLLERLGRVDARVLGQILQLRKVVSSGALLSLERVNEAQQLLSREDLQASGPVDTFQQLSIRAAILEFKRNSHMSAVVLQELTLMQTGAPLPPCSYCKGSRTHPVYLTCNHSTCARCCKSLVKPAGILNCPSCRIEVPVCEVIEVIPSVPTASTSSALDAPLDLTENEADQVNNLLRMTADAEGTIAIDDGTDTASSPIDIDSIEPYVRYLDADADFQNDTSITHTLESLKTFPDPNVSIPPVLRAEYPSVDESLIKHVLACQDHRQGSSAKIKAVADEICKIRQESLEAKICVFSSFTGGLNELEEALNTVTYDVIIETSGKKKLDEGTKVTELSTGRMGTVHYSPYDYGSWDSRVEVFFPGRQRVTHLTRRKIAAEPVVVHQVPSRMVRKGNGEPNLSVNGSNERFEVSDFVESRRPPMPSTELLVGYTVDVENRSGTFITGKITKVHQTGEGGVCYDIKPSVRGPTVDMLNIPPSRIEDHGDDTFRPAVIRKIQSSVDNAGEGGDVDPYANAIGYVRLDGSAGNAEKRGDILNVFRNDPMTSVALLTKTAAGVGLNLTNANYAIILEPSMDAHDEVQSICRVHRIGQTRRVKVLKFYVEGSIEERILKRRQQRGELTVSINALGGATSDDEDGDESSSSNDKKKAAKDGSNYASVSASKAMTLSDLKLLLGK
mmetsp:Transcript_27766/g.60881  ORF Transcript_27766/g.60881 Transcript_27766/m.60881 type:complete len:1570 (-) Transcript_27766:206-4915(-)